ncbi:MAG TPA: glycosyltransferase family 1 protein [Segetibacter sp.]|jgi:glycosyltransferase involved in cell wall biosynthesis
MRIAFDAKRAYQNGTGLGHYSRTLISSLATDFPQHDYFLCAPKLTDRFDVSSFTNIQNVTPKSLLSKMLSSAWRSSWVKSDLKEMDIDIYHGLSNEIPRSINKTQIKSIVTIHDLIFERYPEQYKKIDVQIYRQKFKYACQNADVVIAISQQTKEDIIRFYNIPESKIVICYQSCIPAFATRVSEEEKQRIKAVYNLPEKFYLYVGSIIERKNLLNICKALSLLEKNGNRIPLVAIGDGDYYKQQVKQYIKSAGLEQQVIFLSEKEQLKSLHSFVTAKDFPAIYQQALCMVYPSFFEGFGIPVLEALWSKIPVITSNVSCLPETGGDAAFYVNPASPEEIAEALKAISTDAAMVETMVEKGSRHALKFTPEKCAADVMQVYLRLNDGLYNRH